MIPIDHFMVKLSKVKGQCPKIRKPFLDHYLLSLSSLALKLTNILQQHQGWSVLILGSKGQGHNRLWIVTCFPYHLPAWKLTFAPHQRWLLLLLGSNLKGQGHSDKTYCLLSQCYLYVSRISSKKSTALFKNWYVGLLGYRFVGLFFNHVFSDQQIKI